MSLFDNLAKECFQILKGSGKRLTLYNEKGEQVFDPELARRMFDQDDKMMVSISEDGLDSQVNMYLSNVTDLNTLAVTIDTLRTVATRYNVLFNVRNYGKELSPRDFAHQVKKDEISEGKEMATMYGSTKSSYQVIGSAKLIIRHNDAVNENMIGGRSRNIKAIFVETKEGERFKFPYAHLDGARAMARHISEGGSLLDRVGKHIVRLSEEYSALSFLTTATYKKRSSLNETAISLRNEVRSRMQEIRTELARVIRETSYAETAAVLKKTPYKPKLDEATIGDEVKRLSDLFAIKEGDAAFKALKYAALTTAGKGVINELGPATGATPASATTVTEPNAGDKFVQYADLWLTKRGGEKTPNDVTELANGLKRIVKGVFPGAGTLGGIPKVRYTDPTAELRHKLTMFLQPAAKLPNTLFNYISEIGEKITMGKKLTANEQFFADKLAAMVPVQEGIEEGFALDEWFKQFEPDAFLTRADEADLSDYSARSGLEGPFRMGDGRIYYYDPKAGQYYDPTTDIYVDNADVQHLMQKPRMEGLEAARSGSMEDAIAIARGNLSWCEGKTGSQLISGIHWAVSDAAQKTGIPYDAITPELVKAGYLVPDENGSYSPYRVGELGYRKANEELALDEDIQDADIVNTMNRIIDTNFGGRKDFDSVKGAAYETACTYYDAMGFENPEDAVRTVMQKWENATPVEEDNNDVTVIGGDQGDDFLNDIRYDPTADDENPFATQDAEEFYGDLEETGFGAPVGAGHFDGDARWEDDGLGDDDLDDAGTAVEYCPSCNALNEPMGTLGNTNHFKCRQCGMSFSKPVQAVEAVESAEPQMGKVIDLASLRRLAGLK